MKIKEMSKEDIELLSYDDLAYMILVETNKKYKITDLFKKVCDYKGLSDAVFENKMTLGMMFYLTIIMASSI